MIKYARILLLSTLLLSFQSITNAQTAAVIFQSENNDSIQVSINQIKQHLDYHSNIQIQALAGKKSYNIVIGFKNDTTVLKKNIYLIDNGLTHIYLVNKKSLSLKKIVPSATYAVDKNQLIVRYLENTNMPIDTLTKDSIQQKDTTYVPPFETYYHLEDYKGKIGCPWPIKEDKLAQLKGVILAETLEDNKLEKIKIAIQDMDSVCLMINQLKELLILFEYEETKLDFAKFVSLYLFDVDNVGKLSEVFNFENSLEELKEFIKNK